MKTLERSIKRLFLLLLLSASVTTTRAQEGWTLDTCIRHALKQNPELKNSRLETRIKKEEYLNAVGNFLPAVSADGTLGKRMGRSVDPENNQYTSSSFTESTVGLNISLPLFQGFIRVHQVQFARLNRQISQYESKAEENKIAYQVIETFYRISFEERMWALAAEQRKLSEKYLEQMNEYVSLGLRSPADQQEINARIQADIYQETRHKNAHQAALLELKQLLNLSDPLTAIVQEPEEQPRPLLVEAADLFDQAQEALPQFRTMELRRKAARKSRAIAAGAFSPTLSADFFLNSGYYDIKKKTDGFTVPIHTQFKDNVNKYVGLRVSLPLFTGLSRVSELRKRQIRQLQLDNEQEQLQNSVRTETEKVIFGLQAAYEEFMKAEQQALSARKILEQSQEKWTEGLISVFELMEKRNLFISAQSERFRTRLQYQLQERIVCFYQTGRFIPPQTQLHN